MLKKILSNFITNFSEINKMKNSSALSKSLSPVLAIAFILAFTSCAKKLTFSSSSIVPAATGSVKIKSDKNKNQNIHVSVTHLAPASKLSPPQNTYVVWMVTESNGTKNLGQLKSSGSLLSKALKGSLKTVTSFNPTRFFITAEDNGNVQYPGSPVVLTTN